ncbi:MAG: hypothetical protein ACUVUE_07330 [Candidatus Bathycorpusculaceae bacterium]
MGENLMTQVSKEVASQIVVEFIKRRKNTERIDVSTVEEEGGVWVVRGTCPIDMEGHPWAERFEVAVDNKGKIVALDFALL